MSSRSSAASFAESALKGSAAGTILGVEKAIAALPYRDRERAVLEIVKSLGKFPPELPIIRGYAHFGDDDGVCNRGVADRVSPA
jgi:hypothetical protein